MADETGMPESGDSGPRGELPALRTDGLPTLPNGEPILARWFVLTMLVLGFAAVAVTIWAFTAVDREQLSAAERRPAGGSEVTVERGRAELAETRGAVPGPDCTQAIRIVGDEGSRAAARVAAERVCVLLETGEFPRAREGLVEWIAADGQLRIATFELSGVESSARLEDGRIVVELNAKFQFVDAARAAPALLHQLALISDEAWPGEPVGAGSQLTAAAYEVAACRRLEVPDDALPRGCTDAAELLQTPERYQELLDVGYRDDAAGRGG